MLSSNNILSPAHGAPLATPTQDMILGSYYLTYGPEDEELAAIDPATLRAELHVYRTAQEAELAYEHGIVDLHDAASTGRWRRGRPHPHHRRADHLQRPASSARSRRRWATSSTSPQYPFINRR